MVLRYGIRRKLMISPAAALKRNPRTRLELQSGSGGAPRVFERSFSAQGTKQRDGDARECFSVSWAQLKNAATLPHMRACRACSGKVLGCSYGALVVLYPNRVQGPISDDESTTSAACRWGCNCLVTEAKNGIYISTVWCPLSRLQKCPINTKFSSITRRCLTSVLRHRQRSCPGSSTVRHRSEPFESMPANIFTNCQFKSQPHIEWNRLQVKFLFWIFAWTKRFESTVSKNKPHQRFAPRAACDTREFCIWLGVWLAGNQVSIIKFYMQIDSAVPATVTHQNSSSFLVRISSSCRWPNTHTHTHTQTHTNRSVFIGTAYSNCVLVPVAAHVINRRNRSYACVASGNIATCCDSNAAVRF